MSLKNRPVGRPSEHDPNYVLDIATEYLVARFNRNPKELDERLKQIVGDPYDSIRQNRARFENEHVRLVLKLLQRHSIPPFGVPVPEPVQAGFDADMWFLRHEPPIDIMTAKGREMAEKMNAYHETHEAQPRAPWGDHALEYVRRQRTMKGALYGIMQKIQYIIEAKHRVDTGVKTSLNAPVFKFEDNDDEFA